MVRACFIGFTCLTQNVTEAVERAGFQNRIADLTRHGQGLLKVPGSLLVAAEPQINLAERVQSLGFADCATNFVEQGQGLFEISNRVLVTAQPQVNNAEPW